MNREKRIIEIGGWFGSVAILICFFLVSFGYLSPRAISYLVLNGFGAFCLGCETFYDRAYPSATLNLVYFLIAIVAIIKYFL